MKEETEQAIDSMDRHQLLSVLGNHLFDGYAGETTEYIRQALKAHVIAGDIPDYIRIQSKGE